MSSKADKSPVPCKCQGCDIQFPSRNAVFTHLVQTNGACLDPEEYINFRKYVLANRKRQKVMILYGYIPDKADICNGDDAALILLKTLAGMYDEEDEMTEQQQSDSLRINRSYGRSGRSSALLEQDEGTGAITEVLATRLPVESNIESVKDWLKQVNERVSTSLKGSSSQLRVFGKIDVPSAFNAEVDVGHRRIECLFPVDLLVNFDEAQSFNLIEFFERFPSLFDGALRIDQIYSRSDKHETNADASTAQSNALDQDTVTYLHGLKKTMQSLTTHIVERKKEHVANKTEKSLGGKRIREKQNGNRKPNTKLSAHDTFASDAGEVVANGTSDTATVTGKIRGNGRDKERSKNKNKTTDESSKFLLERKRYHNFTPLAMAHEYLCLRRLDRFYHRATLRFDTTQHPPRVITPEENKRNIRPFLVLSLTADVFLHGQAPRVFGLFVALARGLIDKDIVECVFDEHYPHLVPTPPLPVFAMYAGEAAYTKWEGKMQTVLSPRRQNIFDKGWNDSDTVNAVEEWTMKLRQHTATLWYQNGVDAGGRLVAEKKWTGDVLMPWVERARKQLEHYRDWKSARAAVSNDELVVDTTASEAILSLGMTDLPPLAGVSPEVPAMFERVLHLLRQADASGLWPSTSAKRQLVMVSTLAGDSNGTDSSALHSKMSLSEQCIRVKNTVRREESSAYVYDEGQGGASGSFSVGAMPGDSCSQPKGNTLFPELMKAAFELEIALCPDREPSSTIAINRNAQFRPHTDSGAGAGQSTSLIAGLGCYSGGELVVEGEQHDIRYKTLEFNGWKQRHWTMPFAGERFSLVWFTPKGCEGVHGIDLCA
ncbi:hypothetical protein MPSEU_000243000 [Mayamaea pseudoterrestris]|nr:hypothetical protein MPSEU_000243000 [Mayamaea pseudoterrestris]